MEDEETHDSTHRLPDATPTLGSPAAGARPGRLPAAKRAEKAKAKAKAKKAKKAKKAGKTRGKGMPGEAGGKGKGATMPPGLAKRDALPPGLEKHVERHGTLPPGLAKRDLPADLEDLLPRRRKGLVRKIVGEDVVLLEEATGLVLDVLEGVLAK